MTHLHMFELSMLVIFELLHFVNGFNSRLFADYLKKEIDIKNDSVFNYHCKNIHF